MTDYPQYTFEDRDTVEIKVKPFVLQCAISI